MEVEQVITGISEVIADKDLRLEAGTFVRRSEDSDGGKYPAVKFGELAESYTLGRAVRVIAGKSPYPFYQPSSVTNIKPKIDGYLWAKKYSDIEELIIYKGQVLLTCSGSIGRAVYVSETLDNKILSHDMLRIDCHNPEDSGYLYAYLKSSACQKILQAMHYGAVIPHIESEHLSDIPVPDAPREIRTQIHSLIVQSYSLRDESNAMLDEAEALLVRELGLPPLEDIKPKDEILTFEVSRMDFVKSGRFEASYHDPLFGEIVRLLQEGAEEVTTVGDERVSRKILLPGRFRRVYVEDEKHGAVFIGGKQIGELDPADKKYLAFSQHEDRIREELTIHTNMILITCSGTIGNVALVPEHWDGWTASQHIIRVVPASDDTAGYAYVFLASEWGRELVKRYKYGAVIDEINDEHVSSVPFPLLRDKGVQSRINTLALEANAKRYEAFRLEREAMSIIDLCTVREGH